VRPWPGSARAARPLVLHPLDPPASGGGLRLLGSGALPAGPLPAGAVLPLDLWWQLAEGAAPVSVSVRVTLGEPASGAVAAEQTEPVPADAWRRAGAGSGSVVRQRVALPLLAGAASGRYQLAAQLLGAAGQPLAGAPSVLAAGVAVEARDLPLRTEPPPLAATLDARFGPVELLGADVPAAVRAGETVSVTLAWRALGAVTSAYKVSVQLLDASGAPVAQHDGEPADWTRPTTSWLPGEVVLDSHSLAIPADLAPGRYELLATLYDPATLARLAPAGRDAAGEFARLGELAVR
jgi:hypothetical protein